MGKKLNLEYRERMAHRRTFSICPWCDRRAQFGHAKCDEDMTIASMLEKQGFPQLSQHDLKWLRDIKNEKTYYQGWMQDTTKPLIEVHREHESFSWCELSKRGREYFAAWKQTKAAIKAQSNRCWLDDLPVQA